MHQAFQAWIPALSQRTEVRGHSQPARRKPRKPSPCSENVGGAQSQNRGSMNSDNIGYQISVILCYWNSLKKRAGAAGAVSFVARFAQARGIDWHLPRSFPWEMPQACCIPTSAEICSLLTVSECVRRYSQSKPYSLSLDVMQTN